MNMGLMQNIELKCKSYIYVPYERGDAILLEHSCYMCKQDLECHNSSNISTEMGNPRAAFWCACDELTIIGNVCMLTRGVGIYSMLS